MSDYAGFWIMLGIVIVGHVFATPDYIKCMKVERIDKTMCEQLYLKNKE